MAWHAAELATTSANAAAAILIMVIVAGHNSDRAYPEEKPRGEAAGAGFDAGDRWFRHIPTGSLWRLVSDENPYGPGFWPAHVGDRAA